MAAHLPRPGFQAGGPPADTVTVADIAAGAHGGPGAPLLLTSAARRRLLAATWTTGGVLLVAAAAAAQSSLGWPPAVAAAAASALALVLAWRASRMAVRLGPDVLVSRGALRTARLSPADVAAVDVVSLGCGLTGVRVTTQSGARVRMDAVVGTRRRPAAEPVADAVRRWAGLED